MFLAEKAAYVKASRSERACYVWGPDRSGCGWKMVNKGERMYEMRTEQVLQDLADCGQQSASYLLCSRKPLETLKQMSYVI